MLQREKLKLSDLHRGIKNMKRIPTAIFIVDGIHEVIALKEAKTLDIPTFGIIDSNTNPNVVDFPIPANDDSVKCIRLIMDFISEDINYLSDKNDFMDIWLFAHCTACISTGTGLDLLSVVYNRPILLLNYIF